MKSFFYIPLNSLNLNNILSSESVSPPSFYEKRGYGFKRFEKIMLSPFANTFLAFDKIPMIEDIRTDREEYPIYIAIPEKLIWDANRIQFDDLIIYQIDKTLYLNWYECFFITRNQAEKNKLIASTKRSLEVKHSDSYLRTFCSITEHDFHTFNWNDKVIININDKKNINSQNLFQDQKINKIKGFLYGYVSGKLNEQPEELSQGKLYFQQFINLFSGLMNEFSVFTGEKKTNIPANRKKQIILDINKLRDLKERINILFGSEEEDKIQLLLKQEFHLNDEDIAKFQKFKYKSTAITIKSILIDFLKNKDSNTFSVEELLDNLIENAINFINDTSGRAYSDLEINFNMARVSVLKKINEFNNLTNSNQIIEVIPVKINNAFEELSVDFEELSQEENRYFETIINELLSRSELSTSDEIAQQRKDILVSIAKSLEQINTKFKDSEERNYLLRLHESFKTVGVGFKLNESKNIALQSIASFLNRYSEIDKINDYMIKNNFNNYGLAYGNWGAAYGYANLSKILIDPLNKNPKALKLLTEYVYKLIYNKNINYDMLDGFANEIKNYEQQIINSNTIQEPDNEKLNTILFIDLVIENKKLNINDEWVEQIENCFNEVNNQVSNGGLFDNDTTKFSLFSELLNDRAKKMKSFGKAKIEEALNVYKEFLKNS